MPDDLGAKALALEMPRNGFARIGYDHALPLPSRLVPIGKPTLPKIVKFSKKCRFRLWQEESGHVHHIFLMFSVRAYRYSCGKNYSRRARHKYCLNFGIRISPSISKRNFGSIRILWQQ
ncbi:hypothetical protein FHT82_000631 [Rhizobium sp. BK275]|uniref:hypothetical protein n=1 Tax=Rhizobium sp. BK275 TaxID=2587077 RepID=UPI00161DF1EF|nr:hypothetical protein [Rhizobium sp. BK275]MBB3387911.1 hypothetical protein [Rhizobium sp. BK275]